MDRRMVNLAVRRGLCLAVLVFGACVSYAQVGRITASQGAMLRTGAADFSLAKVGVPVNNGDTVRTKRRSYAEVTFADRSVIRVNERTDMVVQDASTLRKIRLNQGALWVRDARGSNTRVQTPVGTATARGTIFSVTAEMMVNVFEGEVDIEAGGIQVTAGPGETVAVGPNGQPIKLGMFEAAELPMTPGGETLGWWLFDQSSAWKPEGIQVGDFGSLAGLGGALGAFGLARAVPPPPVNPVPEPAMLVVLGLGAALVARKRSKR